MKLIFLGPPGVGKGSVAKSVGKHYGIPHISTGDIFRAEVEKKTSLGIKIEKGMKEGKLVSDEETISIVKKRISEKDCSKGFLFDGFPRTIKQAEALDKMIKIDYIVNLVLDEEYIVKRLMSRRICPKCNRIYNLITSLKPKKDSICDDCNVKLIQREDDNEKVIRDRQGVYKKQTLPLLKYYGKRVKNVDASGEVKDITGRIFKVL